MVFTVLQLNTNALCFLNQGMHIHNLFLSSEKTWQFKEGINYIILVMFLIRKRKYSKCRSGATTV